MQLNVTHGCRGRVADREIKFTPTTQIRYETLLRSNKLQYCTVSYKAMLNEHK